MRNVQYGHSSLTVWTCSLWPKDANDRGNDGRRRLHEGKEESRIWAFLAANGAELETPVLGVLWKWHRARLDRLRRYARLTTEFRVKDDHKEYVTRVCKFGNVSSLVPLTAGNWLYA